VGGIVGGAVVATAGLLSVSFPVAVGTTGAAPLQALRSSAASTITVRIFFMLVFSMLDVWSQKLQEVMISQAMIPRIKVFANSLLIRVQNR
jgi:prepilin signal peptidase PulO-like enzyme (type II secretory pathway)